MTTSPRPTLLSAALGWLALFVVVAFFAAMTVFGTGCKSANATVGRTQQAVTGVAGSLERVTVRADVIATQAKQLAPTPQRAVIVEQAAGIRADTRDGREELAKAEVALRALSLQVADREQTIAVQAAELARLNDVWIAPRMWRLIGLGVIAVVGLGVTSFILGVGSPAGVGMLLSRLINANVMFPFAFARDFFNRRIHGLVRVPVPVAAKGPR